MTKQEFLDELKNKLKGLKNEDVSERLDFYSEMIDDRMEEGVSEENAVMGIGSVDEIAAQIREEHFKSKEKKCGRPERRKMKAWEIVLLAVGSPMWLSLLIAALAIVFSLYTVVWGVLISLWSVFGAFVGCAVGVLALSVFTVIYGNVFSGLLLLGMALVCAGLAIFAFFGCRELTKATVRLTKWTFVSVFVRRRGKYEAIE